MLNQKYERTIKIILNCKFFEVRFDEPLAFVPPETLLASKTSSVDPCTFQIQKKRANSLAIKSITQPVERTAQLQPVKNQEESMSWSTFLVKLPVSKLYIFYSKETKSRVKFFRTVCVENLGVTAAVFFMCCIKLIIQKFY